MKKISNLFGDVLSRSFNVIGQFMKKCCLLLFSISVAIGQFSSTWAGSSYLHCKAKVFISILHLEYYHLLHHALLYK